MKTPLKNTSIEIQKQKYINDWRGGDAFEIGTPEHEQALMQMVRVIRYILRTPEGYNG